MTILHTSPWGRPDSQTQIAEGIISLSTPSHGGIYLSQARYEALPIALQCNRYGGSTFFEEDCEAAIIHLWFDIDVINRSDLLMGLNFCEDFRGAYKYFAETPNARGVL